MAKYTNEFRRQTVAKALQQGIKPTIKELHIAGNTLRTWIKIYKAGGFIKHRHHKRAPYEIENFVVQLKEQNPRLTLKGIQRILKQKRGKVLSLEGIRRILQRFGMAGKSFLPLRGENTIEVQSSMKLAHIFIKQGDFEKAAEVLNSLPALSDFSILVKIPSKFLSLRRQAEQLEALLGILPMAEMYKKADELRKRCEKEKLFFTGIFVATIEMDALNFLGYPKRVVSLYKRYRKYLPGLPLPLKYRFLIEYFISFTDTIEKYPEEIFKNFPRKLEQFCSRLPQGDHRIQWLDAIDTYFQMTGEINKSLKWMEKLFQEVSPEDRKIHLAKYLWLLSTKGVYSKILEFNESFADIPIPFFLMGSLTQGTALLGIGKPKEALEIALNAFYKAEKEHLFPTILGFTFFIACCYASLKENEESRRYLKMSLYFSKNIEKSRMSYSLLLGFGSPVSDYSQDARFRLINLYLLACKNLRRRDYFKAYRFAEKKGLLGFLHRIILLHPEAVINLLKKGKETYLPKEFLTLPVFHEATPMFKLFLLRDKESIFYGDRKINISPHTKDFHLLTYLFLNRKKILNKEGIINIFYKKTTNPSQGFIKTLSRIRKHLGLAKEILTLRKSGVFFDIEAKIDLEEFEEKYRLGRILEKVGEIDRALKEYRACFILYRRGPFKQMGYYYNFAEEQRTVVRKMFEDLCRTLIKNAGEKNDTKMAMKIKKKLEKEMLVLGGDYNPPKIE